MGAGIATSGMISNDTLRLGLLLFFCLGARRTGRIVHILFAATKRRQLRGNDAGVCLGISAGVAGVSGNENVPCTPIALRCS